MSTSSDLTPYLPIDIRRIIISYAFHNSSISGLLYHDGIDVLPDTNLILWLHRHSSSYNLLLNIKDGLLSKEVTFTDGGTASSGAKDESFAVAQLRVRIVEYNKSAKDFQFWMIIATYVVCLVTLFNIILYNDILLPFKNLFNIFPLSFQALIPSFHKVCSFSYLCR